MTELEQQSVPLTNAEGQIEYVPIPKNVLAADFDAVCRIAFWLQVTNRTPPKPIEITSHVSYPKELTNKRLLRILGSVAFRRAANIMGFSLDWINEAVEGLSEDQELAILVLTDPSIRGGLNARLKLAGITIAQYRAWRGNPLFRETIDEIGSRLLSDHETDLMTELVGQAAGGDITAIKYAFEVSGRHNPAQQSVLDVQVVIEKIVEIIAAEVKDQDTLARIGTRLLAIMPGTADRIKNGGITTHAGEYQQITTSEATGRGTS